MRTRHTMPRFLSLSFVLASVCFGCETDPRAIGPRSDYIAVERVLEQFIVDEIDAKELPAVSIAVVDDQGMVWAKGFGYSRPADSVRASSETVYRVGSVSKLFTDIAVMQLVERGELELDIPVSEYLPEFSPENGSGVPITLRHLMSHRSGLVREPPVGHYFDQSEPTLERTVESLNNTELVYAPGTPKYSNAAIAVVGYVLERTQHEPFPRYLERNVLEPLGMTGSTFEQNSGITDALATGMMWTLDGREFEAPTFELGMTPAGSMYSTVEDLARFISVLLAGGEGPDGRILSQATLDEMWKPQFAEPSATSGYGIGFNVSNFLGHRRIGHNGGIYGFATELAVLPDEEIGVVVVTAKDFANSVTGRIADAALETMLSVRNGSSLPVLRSTEPVPPELVGSLPGRYASESTTVELSEWDGRLFLLHDNGGSRVELRAFGDTLVVDDAHAYGMRLNAIDSAIVIAGDTLFLLQDQRPAKVPTAWTGLIGEYGWDHNTLYVLERDGVLNVLVEWLLYYPVEQLSRDNYRFPPRGLYSGELIEFRRGEDGSATSVKLGGVTFERRAVGPVAGEVFRIEPVVPVEELREVALAAEPPRESGDLRNASLTEVTRLDPTVKLDIRYASTNNFMSAVFYDEPRAFLQEPAAEALVRAHRSLEAVGFGLLIHDAYRPWYVTKMFWDATPAEHKLFVANPESGSRHNRGSAADVTLYDLETGLPIQMVGGYDEFSERSYARYPGGTSHQRWVRDLLRRFMEAEDFHVYEFEWWHFDHADWAEYPILNDTFQELDTGGGER